VTISIEQFPSNQIKHMSSQHFLSHRHESRQHHLPKQPTQGGGRGDKMSCRIRHIFQQIYNEFNAIIIVSPGEYGVRF